MTRQLTLSGMESDDLTDPHGVDSGERKVDNAGDEEAFISFEDENTGRF